MDASWQEGFLTNMSYRNREIESKWLVHGLTLSEVRDILVEHLGHRITKSIFGSSVDTYWTVEDESVEADFIRMRERDGIRQITVKGRDRGSNLNRLEVDVDSTSEPAKISRLLTAAFGRSAGKVGKTYHVYWLEGESEHTTICCYSVDGMDPDYKPIVIEVETTSESNLMTLETQVLGELYRREIRVERAPGSLYEMFILNSTGDK